MTSRGLTALRSGLSTNGVDSAQTNDNLQALVLTLREALLLALAPHAQVLRWYYS